MAGPPESPRNTTNRAAEPRLAVMLSGSGRTLVNLLEQIGRGALGATVELVIASRECAGAERSRERGIATVVRPGDIPEQELAALLERHRIDLLVLAGYLRRVRLPRGYRGRAVNIHPSLLPAFGGPGMYGDRVHAAVLNAGCGESGCTVHMVTDEYDEGPILGQARVPVKPGDTVQTLAARVFAAECELYPRVLRQVLEGVAPGGG